MSWDMGYGNIELAGVDAGSSDDLEAVVQRMEEQITSLLC
jgi:hypothetical protein